MNARRKQRLRADQRWQRAAKWMKANRGEPPTLICPRCNKHFIPEWIDVLAEWESFCGDCLARNLFDQMGFGTPPGLLDKYTLKPTLTEEEFQRNLRK